MTYEHLLLEKDGHIATLSLNVPEKLNAITMEMARNLPLAAEEIAQDDDIRVVIVTGSGRGFCSGADVGMMSGGSGERSRYERLQATGWPFSDVFPKLTKPVIAAINGACVGGGLSLALSCDIRIASETARFGVLQVTRGLVPDYGLTFYLPHAIGTSNALKLMFTAEIIDSAEGLRLGIVSQVVAADELMNVARELATKISQQPPVSVELSKKMAWRGLMDSLNRQMDLETYGTRVASQTEDHKESVRAFMEKRPLPEFKGK